MRNLIFRLLGRNRNWYKPRLTWVNGHEFFNTGERLQCVYCLFVQPSVVRGFDRDNKGRVTKITIKFFEEEHLTGCKQKYESKTH